MNHTGSFTTIPARGSTRRGVLVEATLPPRRRRRRAGIGAFGGARLGPSTHARSTKRLYELEDVVGVESGHRGQLRVRQEKTQMKGVVRAVLPEAAGEVAHGIPHSQTVGGVAPLDAAQRGSIQAQVQKIVVGGALQVPPSPWRKGGDDVRVDRRNRPVAGEGVLRRGARSLVEYGASWLEGGPRR